MPIRLKVRSLLNLNSFLLSYMLATVGLIFAPLRDMILSESDFFIILTMALTIDLIVGIIKYIKLRKFHFRHLLTGLMVKVLVSYGGLLLFLAFSTLEDGPVGQWFLLVAKFIVLLYPAGSAFANMYVVSNGRFPPIKLMKIIDMDQLSAPLIPTIERETKRNEEDGSSIS